MHNADIYNKKKKPKEKQSLYPKNVAIALIMRALVFYAREYFHRQQNLTYLGR